MPVRSSLAACAAFAAAVLTAACGGGGGSTGDVFPNNPVPQQPATGPDSFLLFPNPIVLADGSFETNTTTYAEAYYAAIDPNNDKDTLAKWMAANGFNGGPTGALGEVAATFGDVRDLGYGREMRARQNADGTIAFFVMNYAVNAGEGYSYTPLNLDAAVVRDTRWHVGTNAIEFSPGPNGGAAFAKFYTFDPVTGQRLLTASLDGRTSKAMPGICINCHGGRADPLTPVEGMSGKPLFALVANSVSQHRGDTQGRLHMFNLDHLDFSTTAGFRRSDLEAVMKTMNRMVLCTWPLAGAAAGPEDNCRPAAGPNEWQAPAAAVLKAGYGGDGLPNATFSDTYVPPLWVAAGQTAFYNNAVKSACMTCHMQRGTLNQSDLSFIDYSRFVQLAPRTKAHVFDRGNMPLARIVADRFWGTAAAGVMGDWLQGQGYTVRDASNVLLRPGRPIADPGPDRTVRSGAVQLSAANSLYASTYNWSIVTNPGNAGSLANPTSATPTFSTAANGTYVLQLVVGNGSQLSAPANLTLVVNNALAPAPGAIRFTDIKAVLQGACVACHTPPGTAAVKPPIFFADVDRNGDAMTNATDEHWLYKEVRGRVNFTDLAASPLLRKPAGHHHNGGLQPGFDASLAPGDAGRANYDLILNWILNGAPE